MHFKDLIDSQRAMLPWLTIYYNNQYSRWLPYFWSVLTDLPRDRERVLESYADSLTGNPYSGMSSEMIIEVTMNKGSKLKSGTKKGVYKHTESSPRRLKDDEQVVQDLLN